MSAARRLRKLAPPRAGVAAIVLLALAWALTMHALGWAQTAHYAQVRALAAGQPEIDRWHWETKDKAWIAPHFYSVKAPGLAGFTLPAYLLLDAAGAQELAASAAANARETAYPRWAPVDPPPLENYGFDERRADRVQARVESETPMIWALTLIGAVLPATALLLLVRRVADRLEPGYGAAAAVTLGVGTIVMIFAAEYFSHVAAAALGFGAFALLFRERAGPGRPGLVACAGLAAGLAVSFEYPLGLVGAILLVYALARPEGRLRRGAAYLGGAVAGALPALAFNLWAFGSPLRFAYGDAVAVQGETGHDELGLNDEGLFGISPPDPAAAVDLLIAGRGLVTLTPVLVVAVAGTVLLARRGRRAEAAVIGAVALAYFLYNAGYWLPFGGGSPGARFLIPALPFLALGLAPAFRRLPMVTLGLAIPSALLMLVASLTFPLIGDQGSGMWAEWLWSGRFEHTLLTALGVADGWLAVAPVVVAVAAAAVLAARATPPTPLRDLAPAVLVVTGWAAVALLGPSLAGDASTPLNDGGAAWPLVATGAGAALVALVALRYRRRRAGEPERVVLPRSARAAESS